MAASPHHEPEARIPATMLALSHLGSCLRPASGGAATGLVLILAVVGGLAGIALVAGGVEETESVRPDGDIDRVVVHLDAGAVRLTTAETLGIEVTRRSRRFWPVPATSYTADQGTFEVTGTCPRWTLGRCDASIDVALPVGAAVIVSTEAGAIRGSVDASHVEARTSAGSITLDLTGDLTALHVHTAVGSIDLMVPDGVYDVEASTGVGRSRVEVDTSTDAARRIRVHTDVGSVTVRPRPGDTR